jgi:hypothetical protein
MRVLKALGWVLGRPIGWHLQRGDDSAKLAIRETTSLFTLVLTATIGLVIGQIDKPDPAFWYIALYVLVCVANIGGMMWILTAPSAKNATQHAFDIATIQYTRLSFLTTLGVFIIVTWLASTAQLPGQSFINKRPAELGEPQQYLFPYDKAVGLFIPVSLRGCLQKLVCPKISSVLAGLT